MQSPKRQQNSSMHWLRNELPVKDPIVFI